MAAPDSPSEARGHEDGTSLLSSHDASSLHCSTELWPQTRAAALECEVPLTSGNLNKSPGFSWLPVSGLPGKGLPCPQAWPVRSAVLAEHSQTQGVQRTLHCDSVQCRVTSYKCCSEKREPCPGSFYHIWKLRFSLKHSHFQSKHASASAPW